MKSRLPSLSEAWVSTNNSLCGVRSLFVVYRSPLSACLFLVYPTYRSKSVSHTTMGGGSFCLLAYFISIFKVRLFWAAPWICLPCYFRVEPYHDNQLHDPRLCSGARTSWDLAIAAQGVLCWNKQLGPPCSALPHSVTLKTVDEHISGPPPL